VKIQNAFRALTAAADHLNAASDELGRPISELEALLKKLNLGVVVWAEMEGGQDESLEWWSREVGYAKVGGRWGISIRSISGNPARLNEDKEEAWLFNEAPRWMRVTAVEHIPKLIEKMVTETNETAQKIRDKVSEAKEIVTAVRGAFPLKQK